MLGMEQMYKMALDPRIYPDSRLLSIMQGRDNSLPMAIAMAAKQQRDKLKTAEAGAQAQQGAKQPTVKDKMLASSLPPEHTGLGALPAENMADMDEEHMAAGGIVAFADRGTVPSPEGDIDSESYENKSEKPGRKFDRELWEGIKNIPGSISNFLKEQNRSWTDVASNTSPSDMQAAASGKIPKGTLPTPSPYANLPATVSATPTPLDLKGLQKGGPQDPNYISPQMQAEINRQSAANPPGAKPGGPGAPPPAAPNAPQAGIGEPPKRIDRFAGLGETQEAFDKKLAAEKNAGQAEFLMNMGLKMMTTVGPIGKAIGEGGIAGLPSLSASRKTIRELEKARSDFQLNMARYQTAADEGDMDLAYKYRALAEKTAHDAGMLAVEKTKAGAYAASVGNKTERNEERLNAAILKGATDIHNKNMENFKFASEFAKMDPISKQQYFAGLRSQAAQLAGKQEEGNVAGTGYSMSEIDAAIARKEKKS